MRVAAALLAALCALARAEKPAPGPTLPLIVVDGTINPATASFLRESIARAHAAAAPALVVQLDTPGGLLSSMQVIVKELLNAPLPVIVWVAPSGAMAGSAGVFVTLAAHVAAMAPGTSIGAAHPVGPGGEEIRGKPGEKIEKFAASFSGAIARRRSRNVDWAMEAVRTNASAAAEDAARLKVIDFVAKDLDELVARAEGRKVEVAGRSRKLVLATVRGLDGHVRTETYAMRLSQRVLNVIAEPQIAYLLMLAGLLGLYVELTHPGVALPGVAGAICLLLALAALQVLPVNVSGLALLFLGIALLVAEAFLPTAGVLGVGGVLAFILGSLFLFDADSGVAVPRSIVFGAGGSVAAIMLVVGVLVLRSQRARAALGVEGMLGELGVARGRLGPAGTVVVRGEYWSADSDDAVDDGEQVEVTGVEGLRLKVRRVRAGSR